MRFLNFLNTSLVVFNVILISVVVEGNTVLSHLYVPGALWHSDC